MGKQPTEGNKQAPQFIYVSEKYYILTSEYNVNSNQIIEISFKDFANNKSLLEEMKLVSDYAGSSKGESFMAAYIPSICQDPKESEKKEKYLSEEGDLKIVVHDKKLFNKLEKALKDGN